MHKLLLRSMLLKHGTCHEHRIHHVLDMHFNTEAIARETVIHNALEMRATAMIESTLLDHMIR
jgi:hypothetical protein